MFNIGLPELLIFILPVALVTWLIVRGTRTSRQAKQAMIEMNARQKRAE